MKINRTNYEDFLIQKLEGLLSTEQNAELDLFLHSNADIKSEWEAFEQTVLVPDETIVYAHKELLKKKGTVLPMYRTMLYVASIAASLLLVFIVSQKYFFNNKAGENQLAVINQQSSIRNLQQTINNIQPTTNTVTPSKNNALVADNYPYNPQPSFSKQVSAVSSQLTTNHQPPTTNLPSDILPMKSLAPTAMKTYPRVSYASFIWTKGLKTPHTPARTVNEAGAWLQVASILGAEIMRISGRGERVNKAPLELQFKKPIEVNINNQYFRFHKLISFHSKKKNNQ